VLVERLGLVVSISEELMTLADIAAMYQYSHRNAHAGGNCYLLDPRDTNQ